MIGADEDESPYPIPSVPFNKTFGYLAGRYNGSFVSSSAPITLDS